MQAAVLSERLRGLEEMTRSRRALAARYRAGLDGVESVVVPPEQDAGHVYHLFPVLAENRDALQRHLKQHGVETLVHYPVPIPRQPALALEEPADCPVATGSATACCRCRSILRWKRCDRSGRRSRPQLSDGFGLVATDAVNRRKPMSTDTKEN